MRAVARRSADASATRRRSPSVMRGTAWPARLPSKRVKARLRRATTVSTPRASARSIRASSWSSTAPPTRAWSSSVRSRCSCSVAGNSTRREPGGERRHGRVPVGVQLARDLAGSRSMPRERLDGTRSGTATAHVRWCGAGRRAGRGGRARRRAARARPAGAGGRRRPGAARRGSAPSVARRSASGRSESSCTRVGKSPSASPHTNTRSRSSPRPSADVAHEQPVAEAAHSAQVGVELELERAPEHVDARRRLDRVEPGEAGRGRRRSSRRPAARPRATTRAAASGARCSRTRRSAQPARSRQLAAGSTGESRTGWPRSPASARRVGRAALVALRTRVAVGDRALGLELALERRAYRSSRCCHCSGLRTISAARLIRSQLALGTSPALAVDRGGGEQPHDVVALEVAVGEREQAEEPAAERAVGEGAHGGAVVRDARPPRAARARGVRTVRARRRAPPCARGARRRGRASTTSRTTARTSSSGSDADTTRVSRPAAWSP